VALETGTVLNNLYRVIKLLGKGAMGNVYLVERIKEDKKFVVKELIFSSKTGPDPETAREIFFREAEFMVKFDHPGMPRTHGIFSEDGKDYLVMDYIEGDTLEDLIEKKQEIITIDNAIKWTLDLANILDYLHNYFHAPIVYRDLKPSNIIITSDNSAKLVDFGIARYYNPDKNTDTFSYGSPGYAAPEQYKGRGQSSPQTDVFGLGVILFQMLTKYDPTVKPFSFPSMDSLNPSVSGELANIVIRAIELDPLNRYISIRELKESLEKYTGKYKDSPSEKTISERPPFFLFRQFHLIYGLVIVVLAGFFMDFYFGTKVIIAIFSIFFCAVFFGLVYFDILSGKKDKFHISISELIIMLMINGILAAIFLPGFLCARGRGQLAACSSNMEEIAIRLEMYAEDNDGLYPEKLDLLNMKPRVCPCCEEVYNYEHNDSFDNYTLSCGKPESHIKTHSVTDNGCWPQYSPHKGIMYNP